MRTFIDWIAEKFQVEKMQLSKNEYAKAGEEGGETRGGTAETEWKENWQELLPISAGGGRFVLHHHWRGLSEEESKFSEEQLLQTDHSLHEDLRLEGPKALWGWSAFTGTTENVRKAGGCRLCSLPADDNLQAVPKLPQPKEWLRVGVGKPYVSEPGGVGATSQSYSKFFAIDTGTYKLGAARQHLFEIFLHGNKLKGRFLVEYAPVGVRRVWLLDRPQSQESYTSAHKLEDVLQELKSKGQRYLVWGDGKGKPVLYNTETGKPAG